MGSLFLASPCPPPISRQLHRRILALASLVLTHNISAILFIPVFAVYLLILAVVFRSPRPWGLLVAGGVATLLSAIYWLPAFAELQFTP